MRTMKILSLSLPPAEVIISGDSHLRQLRVFRGIPIMGPREFLDRHPVDPTS
ncbi:MAG: hypothetical protein ACRELA_25015 [Candidatus Rokuibacteriota bacterium]